MSDKGEEVQVHLGGHTSRLFSCPWFCMVLASSLIRLQMLRNHLQSGPSHLQCCFCASSKITNAIVVDTTTSLQTALLHFSSAAFVERKSEQLHVKY